MQTSPNESEPLKVIYELAAGPDHELPLGVLTRSLASLDRLFQSVDAELGNARNLVELRFRASESGSVEILLGCSEIVQQLSMMPAMLPPYARLAINMVTGPDGLLSTIAACNHRGIDDHSTVEPGMEVETAYGKAKLSKEVAKRALERTTRENVWGFLEPLRGPAESVSFEQPYDSVRRISRADLGLFRPASDDVAGDADSHEAGELRVTLIPQGIHFEGNYAWRMRYKDKPMTVSLKVADPEFQRAVDEGLVFVKGCELDASVRFARRKSSSDKPKGEIVKVWSLTAPEGQRLYEPSKSLC